MIVARGLGTSLLVTQGYGRKYLSPFCSIRDFEKSFYKFIEDNYNAYPVYYGNIAVNANAHDIWLYCSFSELNVETGHFSQAYIDVVTRIHSIDEYNTQLTVVIDELRELFTNSDIDLYDFTYPEYPQKILDAKIIIQDTGKQIYERVEEIKFEEADSLLQAVHMTVKLKLLENFARSRTV